MRLRNKKTGEVFDAIVREKSNDNGEYSIIVCNLRTLRSARIVSSILGEYDTLAKFNGDWEDYTPVEPLIKDEKIRKAVRAWADAIGVDKVVYADSGWHYEYFRTVQDEQKHFIDIVFWSKIDADLLDGATYTITELCGEEEEK